MQLVQADAAGIAAAVSVLNAGGVVAYPTETVYGLAVDPFSESALEKLFAVKGRDENNPILLIVAGEEQLAPIVAEQNSEKAQQYCSAFWPGPLSLLFPKHPDLSATLTAGREKVSVRCPASSIARALCAAFGAAVTSTSANRSGEPPAQSVEEATLPGVDLLIDGGRLAPSPPSTVFDPETGTIYREGVISEADLRAVLDW